MSITQLRTRTGKDRNIIAAICVDLENESLIRSNHMAKSRIYYATERAHDVIFYYPHLLQRELTTYFSAPYSINLPDLTGDDIENEHKRFDPVERYYSSKTDYRLADMEKILHNFSLRIGIFLTYLLIRVSSPEFIKKMTSTLEITSNMMDLLVREWLKYAFVPSIDLLLDFGRKVSKPGQYPRIIPVPIKVKGRRKQSEEKSSYELDPDVVGTLLEVYSNTYPETFKSLESIFHNQENSIKREKEQIKMILCDHKFEYNIRKGPRIVKTEKLNDGTKIEYTTQNGTREFFCKKCDRKVIQNLDDAISDKSLIETLNSLPSASKNIPYNASLKSKNYRYRKLSFNDIVKSPYVFRCKNNHHVWERQPNAEDNGGAFLSGHALQQNFQCILCYENRDLIVLDEKAVKDMREAIKTEVGGERHRLKLLDLIAYQFYKHQSGTLSSKELDFLYPGLEEGSLPSSEGKTYSRNEFLSDKEKILNILSIYKFIDVVNTSKKVKYIRRGM